MNKIFFVAIAKRWFDKVNGNTYHSVQIMRVADGAKIYCPFEYGYGDQYRATALNAMIKAGWLYHFKRKDAGKHNGESYTTDNVYGNFERENDYPICWSVTDGLKRECVANGKGA